MIIKKAVLKNFRNFELLDICFNSEMNFITGSNGSGKTNIIESISVLSQLKSFRNADERSIIKWGSDSYFISLESDDGSIFDVGCGNYGGKLKKRVKINGTHITRISDYYGKIKTVSFSPDDSEIINGSPDARRKYFDSVISKTDNEYLNDIYDFRKINVSRNKVLKEIREKGDFNCKGEELDIWDEMFSLKTFNIIKKRFLFIDEYKELFQSSYEYITGGSEHIYISYSSTFKDCSADDIKKGLKKNRIKDILNGSSLRGPHRDQYFFKNEDGLFFETFASQGQKRAAAISVKNAEKKYLEKKTSGKCILLVDDVFSELDEKRRLNMVKELCSGNQVLFTMVHIDEYYTEIFKNCRIFDVEKGSVSVRK